MLRRRATYPVDVNRRDRWAVHVRGGYLTYGVSGPWGDPDGNGVHGLSERLEVRSVYVGRDYLFDLVKALAE